MDYTLILKPLAEGAVTAASLLITAGVAYGLNMLSAHLKGANLANAASAVASANSVFQSTVQNASADLVKGISDGSISINDKAGLSAAAHVLAEDVKAKIPAMIQVLQPAEGAIASAIVSKAVLTSVGNSPATPVPAAPVAILAPAEVASVPGAVIVGKGPLS